MYSNITIEELMPLIAKNKMTLIDVRSPSEFENFNIPGSINIPIFDDNERAEIGTIYNQESVEAAEERGLEIVSAKLPTFIHQFKGIEGEKTVFCWRGGMRSKTTATLLDLMKVHVHRLEGGIRAYRKWIVDQLEHFELKQQVFTVNGLTGTGKTEILFKMEKEGFPVINLETMANHRGSIFGQIGREPNNQKKFDSLLVHRLYELRESPYIIFEVESKRIGKAAVPPFLNQARDNGTQIFIEMPLEERVKNILNDYQPWDYHDECIEAFEIIKPRIHTPIAKEISRDLKYGNYPSAVRLLLEHYYDPRYQYADEQHPTGKKIHIQVQNMNEAEQAVKDILSSSQVQS